VLRLPQRRPAGAARRRCWVPGWDPSV